MNELFKKNKFLFETLILFKEFKDKFFATKESLKTGKYFELYKKTLPFYFDLSTNNIFVNKNFIYQEFKYKSKTSLIFESIERLLNLIKSKKLIDFLKLIEENKNYYIIHYKSNIPLEMMLYILDKYQLNIYNKEISQIKSYNIILDIHLNFGQTKEIIDKIIKHSWFFTYYFIKKNEQQLLRNEYIDRCYDYLENMYILHIDKNFKFKSEDLSKYKNYSKNININNVIKNNKDNNIKNFLKNPYLPIFIIDRYKNKWNFNLNNLRKEELIYIPEFMKVIL